MEKYLPGKVNVEFKYYDDECSQDKASERVIDTVRENKCIHVIMGPICDYSLGKSGSDNHIQGRLSLIQPLYVDAHKSTNLKILT